MKGKHDLCTLAFLLLIVHQGTSSSVDGGAPESFVRTKGNHFVLNGQPFYSNGFNSYWLMFIAADPASTGNVSSTFRQASRLGLKVVRAWAFSDGGSMPLQTSPGSYDENMFKALDFVISEAKKYGVHLILSLVNSWPHLGGRKQYVQWARERGQTLNSYDDFYSNDVVKGYYKNHVKAVLTRVNTVTGVAYKDDPTIFSWELMNEPRCTSDLSGKTLQAWITEMAAHVKSIDSNHMLEVGLEGFYGDSKKQYNPNSILVGTDFISNHQVPGIDFATIHAYPDQWMSGSNDDTQVYFTVGWIGVHAQDAGQVLGKPLLLTEFGKSSADAGFTVEKRDALFTAAWDAIYSSAKGGGPCAGGLFWQNLQPNLEKLNDGYQVVLADAVSTTGVALRAARRMSSLGAPRSK